MRNIPIIAKLLLVILTLILLHSATSAQVNNCCSVDRQCATDEEWVSGYYAFRNSQCGADSQQQPRQANQDQTPPQSNNCCFSDWQCSTDDEWTNGYWAFQADQCDSSQSDWQNQWRQSSNSNGVQGSNRNKVSSPETVSVVFDPSDPDPQDYELDDGTPVEVIRGKPGQMCEWFPWLDPCR